MEDNNLDQATESLNTEAKDTIDNPAGNDDTVDDSQNSNEESQSTRGEENEDVVTLSREDYERLQKSEEVARNQRIRAEKAEKDKKDREKSNTAFTKEEGVLYAKVYNNSDIPQEMKDSAVERVMKIAKIDGITTDEAYKSADFKVWKDARIQEMREKEAQLGNSRGSKSKQKKTLDTPELSEQEHKALWRQSQK